MLEEVKMAIYTYRKIYPIIQIEEDIRNIGINVDTVTYKTDEITIITFDELTFEELEKLDKYMFALGFERV